MALQEMLKLRLDNDGKLPAYAWPGGYPILYLTKDGSTLCPECADKDFKENGDIEAYFVYYEGPPIACDDCEEETKSTYGEVDNEE